MNYGLIAEKVGHSFSADIHHRLFGYDYELLALPQEALPSFMTARQFKAINVTIPYKEAVIPYLDEVDETAKAIGAVNTVVNRDGKLVGYNTDFLGLRSLICRSGISLNGKKVLILGSGGTSKTAVAVARDLGCGTVYRVSRDGKDGCLTYEQAKQQHADAEILINTTPCGMYPHLDIAAVDVADFPCLTGVADVVYNPLRSRLVCDAAERGIPSVGGLYMLVAQAAYAAEKFVGKSVPQERIEAVYREMLAAKKNIVLIGMPACGKSTIGKQLAETLGMSFVDGDEEIVRRENKSIPSIFSEIGERGFRDIEEQVIRALSSRQNTVIATGGGAILREENIRFLRENGRIYFIDRPLSRLVATDDRPLSSTREDLQRRYEERYPLYCRLCDCHIQSNDVPADTVKTIIEDFNNENFSA